MSLGKSIGVVMPAYNAERTLERTYNEIPHDIVDDVILVGDNSSVVVMLHPRILGTGRRDA